jgi:predicted GIY-YIG superfamily endonuclease
MGTMRAWAYLLLSERGEVYLGATTDLRSRLRSHNAPDNNGWTRGRRWHLLAVATFPTRAEAFNYERDLKRRPHKKIIWKLQSLQRASELVRRHRYSFSPETWLAEAPSYLKAALPTTATTEGVAPRDKFYPERDN